MATDPNLVTTDLLTAEDIAAAAAADDGDAFNGADPAAFDHDGNGAPGGSKPARRAKEAPKIGERVKKGAPPPAPRQNLAANTVVMVRVTKTGHGRVHDGEGGVYDWNDEVPLPYGVAQAQEKNSNVEIIG